MKVYLSGPMRGHPNLNFPAFHKYAKKLRKKGHVVISPAEMGLPQEDVGLCLAVDLLIVCTWAEAIAVMPKADGSSGVFAELAAAVAKGGLRILYL